MKKKIFLAILSVIFALSLSLAIAGCDSCNDNPDSENYTVKFLPTEHVLYECDLLEDGKAASGEITVKYGSRVAFNVEVERHYTQTPKVTANDTTITASDGVYSVVVNSDTEISVEKVNELDYTLEGTGASDEDPFLIYDVRDLNYVASMINAGTPDFVLGYYSLQNDIDCGGANLEVMGNGTTVNSFFAGFFNGNGHTISNYKIESRGIQYVGLFGFVQSNGTSTTSGTILNLNLKDFEINAYSGTGSESNALFVGAFAGSSTASKLIACSAVGGTINVYANNHFAYAGGAIGVQQSGVANTANGGLYPFYGIVNYVNTAVDIFCSTGYIYSAGGITGFLVTENEIAPAFISNSYSEGTIVGAIRAGGIAGTISDYSSVINCYSTGEIEAGFSGSNPSEDYDALAGGIVAFAGNNTIIANCFTTSDLYAESEIGKDHAVTGEILARGVESSDTMNATSVYNCYAGNQANGTSADFIKNSLKWNTVDWIISDGSLPTINHSETSDEVSITVTINYGENLVEGSSSKDFERKIQNYYSPIIDYFFFGDIPEVVKSENGLTTYGYYFDSELTQKIPYGYVPTGDITLYAGFADYSKVAGVYYYTYGGRTLTIELTDEGVFNYIDGIRFNSSFYYDGNKIHFNDGLFARLSEVIQKDDNNNDQFNLNYDAYKFVGELSDNTISVYDGVFFTKDNPLVLTSTKPVKNGDEFKGVWEKSATINKIYSFDGKGGWTYSFKGKEVVSGTYTVNNGVATLVTSSGSAHGTAKLDASGLLIVNDDYYCLQGSLFGVWSNSDGSFVRFDGYGGGLTGEVLLYINSTRYELTYTKDAFFGENSLTLLNGYSLFGYLTYSVEDRTLKGVLLNESQGGYVDGYVFYLNDNYMGEWVGETTINGVDFSLTDFNGLGIYEVSDENGLKTSRGYIEINGEKVPYTVSVENGLVGRFEYKGVEYALSYDDVAQSVTISYAENTANLVRKDELCNYKLVDSVNSNVVYTFNGGGYLSRGGKLTVSTTENGIVSEVELGYKINGQTDILNKVLNVDILSEYNGTKTGTLTISGNKFALTIDSSNTAYLDIYSPFTGTWAVSNRGYNFVVGNFDLSFTSKGRFTGNEMETVYHWNVDGNYLSFEFIAGNSTQSSTIYILYLEEGNLAVASYPYISANDTIYYASIQDEMCGVWYNSVNNSQRIEFDGLADSKYTNGIAFDYLNQETYLYTRRFGKLYMWLYNDENTMYVLESVSYLVKDENVFNDSRRRAYRFVKFDAKTSSVLTATDENNTSYNFFIDGSVEIGNRDGNYSLVDVKGNVTVLRITLDGEEYDIAVNHEEKTVERI